MVFSNLGKTLRFHLCRYNKWNKEKSEKEWEQTENVKRKCNNDKRKKER